MPEAFESEFSYNRLPIEKIRLKLHACLQGCRDAHTQRIIYKIELAQTPADLWLLRSDLYQCIARVHSQSVAKERINGLVNLFQGWLPDRQLILI
ncbi:MAG: hypothetical protein H7346_08875 [Burkholderiaceae bacterium]|nr:hypothetical protein [Burkholderiaceae bacterium]